MQLTTQTKGKVERLFSYMESSLLNGRTFSSLEHLNETTAWWLAHGRRPDPSRDQEAAHRRFRQEQPHLLKLPARAYDTAKVVYRVVDVERMITYENNLYSTPWRFIGRLLPVRVTEQEVIVYDPASLEVVAYHSLVPRPCKGERRIDARRIAQHATPRSRKRYCARVLVSWANRQCDFWMACSVLIGMVRARPARC